MEELKYPAALAAQALGRRLGLCVVLVGDREDSKLYVQKKEEACRTMDMHVVVRRLPESVSQAELDATVEAASADASIDGVLVQLPLPAHLDEERVMERIDPRKDVDGFHPLNMGRMLARGIPARFVPATALGCMELLERNGIDVTHKRVVVIGDSNIVGTPLAMLFRDSGAGSVTVCHRKAYANIFRDRHSESDISLRAQTLACLPRLPGPHEQPVSTQGGRLRMTPVARAAEVAAEADWSQERSHPDVPDVHSHVEITHLQDSTRVSVEAGNRIGLLNQLTAAFKALGLDVVEGSIATSGERARDTFRVQDAGGPVMDERKVEQLRATLQMHAVGSAMDIEHLTTLTRSADIVVVAVGYPELLRAGWIKPGAVILDVGINVVPNSIRGSSSSREHEEDAEGGEGSEEGGAAQRRRGDHEAARLVGDVAFEEVQSVAHAVSPVPGGVGPMTIASVLHNIVLAAAYQADLVQW